MSEESTRDLSPELTDALQSFLPGARWFSGKGRDFSVSGVRELDRLEPDVRILLVDVEYAEGPSPETYQLPVVAYAEPQDRLEHALIHTADDLWLYDAVHDREAMAAYLRAFLDESGSAGDDRAVTFHRLPEVELDADAHSTLFPGEQSNSSVAFGEEAMLKVFRKVTAGHNPDVEIHRVLTEAGSTHIAQLYGWVSDGSHDLAMLSQFLRTSSEGWEVALTSVRNLLAAADLYPEDVGGDFAAEAHRLGAAVAEVHADLRGRFPTAGLDTGAVAAAMTARLEACIAVVPELAEVAAPARAAYDALSRLSIDGPVAQRVHGDLHLGQTLRTSLGWKLVDFEGEPARPLAERLLPDSPWRDVAGMLRSFDYAASTVERDFEVEPDAEAQLLYRGEEWVKRNREAFLAGYSPDPLTPPEQVLLTAYELDKAVYEVGYEARNRPAWLDIPLRALERAGDA